MIKKLNIFVATIMLFYTCDKHLARLSHVCGKLLQNLAQFLKDPVYEVQVGPG